MDLNPALQTFIAECQELLTQMEESLLQLENDSGNRDLLDAVFRAAHTIKGSAGLFGFDPIVRFTHQVETLLDRLRDGELVLSSALSALLLRCGDHIGALILPITTDAPLADDLINADAALSAELAAIGTTDAAAGTDVAADLWSISLRFGPEVLRNGMDPLSFIRYLSTLGELVEVQTRYDRLPSFTEIDPEACYLDFDIRLRSDADRATIDGVFDFVRDDCEILIQPPTSHTEQVLERIAEFPANHTLLGEILVASTALTPAQLDAGLAAQQAATDVPGSAPPLGEILVAGGTVAPVVVDAALDRQQQLRQQKSQDNRLIRVDADKLDQLITLVGELVIAGSGIHAGAQRAGLSDIVESAATLARLVEEVRDSALGLRMVQIGPTFQRFQRVVRDVSREIGKDIELEISGGDTELDKTVVERIGDPLMHLVRNAMDHGIEPTEQRLAAGKTARARVGLHAYHDSGSIVIEVSDDGGGLNTEKIRLKAVERGLLSASATPTTQEINQLIFEPGFSTADAVSNLSGRGVGMDVVRRNIEALRGTIDIDSQPGSGTTVRIRLPLTLAIIDGFLVGLGAARYVLPLDVVVECIELSAADRRAVTDQGFLNIRGEALPVLRLRDAFDLGDHDCRRENIVVVRFGALKAGLVVDELLGELQTVIKPLGKLFSFLQGISGSTILGSGDVALILDVPGLIKRAEAHRSQGLSVA